MWHTIRTQVIALVTVALAWAVHLAYHAPQLPERVASHFGFSGEPDGWMSREPFIAFLVGSFLLVMALLVALAFGVMWLPSAYINLKNRAYWFSPERERHTRRRLLAHLLWLPSLISVCLMVTNAQIFRANAAQPGPPRLGTADFFVGLGMFLATIGLWTWRFLSAFRLRPGRHE